MILELLMAGWQAILGPLLLVAGINGIRISRRLRTPAPVAPQVDAVADLLETKGEIRKDELRRWTEAWGRAAGHGEQDFWTTVQEIREIEYRAVAEDRRRRLEAEHAARALAIEQAAADRAARAAEERRQADEERAAIQRHQAHLAERRRRYAEARRTR